MNTPTTNGQLLALRPASRADKIQTLPLPVRMRLMHLALGGVNHYNEQIAKIGETPAVIRFIRRRDELSELAMQLTAVKG